MKVQINNDAFKGLTHFNGQVVSEDIDKGTGNPVTGVTGLVRFSLKSGGGVYLSPDQYTVVK